MVHDEAKILGPFKGRSVPLHDERIELSCSPRILVTLQKYIYLCTAEPWEGSASCNFESASLCDWRNLPSIGTWSSATNGGDINFDGVTGAGSKFALARFNTVSAAMARLLSPMIGTGITTTSASYSLDVRVF